MAGAATSGIASRRADNLCVKAKPPKRVRPSTDALQMLNTINSIQY